ncbi:MAG TPA: YkvA family protein [Candidatus Binatia bacterium]
MAINPTGVIKSLGWGRFFQLLVHLPSFLKLFSRLVKDPRVNLAPKLVVLGALAYVVLPTDLVPDFVPGLGQADDVAVLLAGLRLFLRLCPPEIVQEHVKSIATGK